LTITRNSPALLPVVEAVRAVDKRFQLFAISEVAGDICPNEVCASSGIQGSVGDLADDPVSQRPLRGPGVSERVEEQPQPTVAVGVGVGDPGDDDGFFDRSTSGEWDKGLAAAPDTCCNSVSSIPG
jgi:hypothetical protein